MKIIFLGLLFCEDSLARTIQMTKCGIQYAPHIFQANLLEGFATMDDIELHVINIPPTGSFPINSKELFSKEYHWGKNRVQISYFNLPFVKHIEQEAKLHCKCRKILAETDEPVYILMYSPYPPFLNVCAALKKEFKNVRCCMILTDPVPGRGDLERFMTPKAVREGNKIIEKAKSLDSFVVLTKYLADSIEAGDRPYEIIECICDDKQPAANETSGSNKIVLYSGTLEREYGILDTAKAFTFLPDAELWIYGRGNAEAELLRLSNDYPNIKFFGFADQATIEQARNQCDYLINPRRPTGTFTKYSFPSKTAEYMVSGKPVIMYKLEGIPDAYDEHLNYLSAATPEAIADQLQGIFSQDYKQLVNKAQVGREFMIKNKSPEAQSEAIKKLFFKKANI